MYDDIYTVCYQLLRSYYIVDDVHTHVRSCDDVCTMDDDVLDNMYRSDVFQRLGFPSRYVFTGGLDGDRGTITASLWSITSDPTQHTRLFT